MNYTDESTSELSLNIPYTVCEVLVAVMAIIGNALVIIVFRKERRLRRRTNYYIVSLAVADFLVGLLGIPFAIMASVGLPTNFRACLFTVSLLVVLCTISIFCLVAVSIDRYWAILHPMGYSRNVRTKTAIVIISICWVMGTIIGFLPLMGWNAGNQENQKCFFVSVMDDYYLVFLYFATIVTPALLLAAFYAHIYRVVLKQLRQIVTMNPGGKNNIQPNNNGTMLRVLGAAQKREVKATKNLSIIVLFFMVCWLPLYTMNCVNAFLKERSGEKLTYTLIILSHFNSAVNPLLYAYHLRDFRAAMKYFILGLFGIKKSTLSNDKNYRASIASNTYSVYKMQQMKNTQSPEYQNSYRQKSMMNDTKRLPICMPIVKSTTALAAASAGERTMWMITEVPSASISENNQGQDSIYPDGNSVVNVRSDSSSSGIINSAYMEGPIDDLEIGDDEVFYADVSVGTNSNFDSDYSEIFKRSDKNIEFTNRTEKKKRNSRTWCLSNSSPQLFRSLFLVEEQVKHCESASPVSEKHAGLKKRKSVTVTSGSGDPSPARSLKISSLKTVGDFLLQHTPGKHFKCGKKCDESTSYDVNSKSSLAIAANGEDS